MNSTSTKPSSDLGTSTARDAFFKQLLKEIPEEDRMTFDADPNFEHPPPGIQKGDAARLLAVPQTGGYTCVTQKTITSINIGLGISIPRWKPGKEGKQVVVKWAALKTGYPTEAHAKYATYTLAQAASDWSEKKVGVTFEWVTKLDDAAFVLEYGGNKGTVLAEAFFPNGDPLSSVFVYKSAFAQANLPYLRNIFLHELGHVLGLRHEFALEKEKMWAAVRFGRVNPDSVMSYNFPPKIHAFDVEDTRSFYQYDKNEIDGKKIDDWEPDN